MSPNLDQYGPLALRMFQRGAGQRVPLVGSLELTHRCNLACVHCYVNLPAGDREAQRGELTTEQVCRIVDELAELGTLKLTLTGGEPLLRPDFADIYRYAHGKGILLVVYTNATMITESVAKLFAEHRPAKVDITQYGYSRDTYDAVAAAGPGSFERFHRGIALLREHGVPFALKAMALRMNAHEVEQMAELADELGVEFRFDPVISPRIDGGRGPLAQRLSPPEITALEDRMTEGAEVAWEDYCGTAEAVDDRYYACGAGRAAFTIDPYGKLHVCELSRRPGWDVVAHGFERGWYEAIPELLAARRPTTGCGSCATAEGCSSCAGMAELEGRTNGVPTEYFCEMTDGRYRITYGRDRPTPSGLVPLRLGRDAPAVT